MRERVARPCSRNFLKQPSTTHYHIGLKIFNQLVTEMNQASPGRDNIET